MNSFEVSGTGGGLGVGLLRARSGVSAERRNLDSVSGGLPTRRYGAETKSSPGNEWQRNGLSDFIPLAIHSSASIQWFSLLSAKTFQER